MNAKQIDNLIDALREYELSLAGLYDTFGKIFPASKDAWVGLAEEERLHAKWVDALHTHLKNENLGFNETKLTIQSAATAVGHISRQVDKAKNKRLDLKQAVTIAMDVEKSLLESAFFKVFDFNSPEAQKTRNRLQQATRIHQEKLVEWFESIK